MVCAALKPRVGAQVMASSAQPVHHHKGKRVDLFIEENVGECGKETEYPRLVANNNHQIQ